MAHPDIIISGATYPTVPSIVVPKSGGGSAEFYDMDDVYSWLGKDAQLVDDDLCNQSFLLSDTAFNGWTPSTTARTCKSSSNLKTRAVTDMDEYEYFIIWQCGIDVAYNEGTTDKARALFGRSVLIQELFKRPSSWAMIQGESFNGNTCASILNANFLRYYGSTAGSVTYSWSVSYGFYFTATASTFSPTTGNATITFKTPVFYARCSTTYLSTANCALINQEETPVYIKGKLFKIKKQGILRGAYSMLNDMINGNGW